jgi:hypothetical protein
MSVVNALKIFKKGLIDFISDLQSQFPEEGELSLMKITIENDLAAEEIVKNFIIHGMRYRDMVKKREESFFLSSGFEFLDSSSEFKIKDKWKDLDDETKDAIWMWFDYHYKNAMAYQKLTGFGLDLPIAK